MPHLLLQSQLSLFYVRYFYYFIHVIGLLHSTWLNMPQHKLKNTRMNLPSYPAYKDVCPPEFIYMYLLKFCSKNFSVNCEIDTIDSSDISDVPMVSETVLQGVRSGESFGTFSVPLAFCSASRSNSPVSIKRCCFPNRCSFLLCKELKNWLQTLQYNSLESSS